MEQSGITYLLWQDLAGIIRTRGVPTRDLEKRAAHGLGWACAGQALTAFEDIVDNPWGPMDEVRQIPDLSAKFEIMEDENNPAFNATICNSKIDEETPWDCCVRSFYQRALDELKAETGLTIMASFEHEFSIYDPEHEFQTPFSIAAARHNNSFFLDLEKSLTHAGVTPYTIEPEYGLGQFEVACAPEIGVKAADCCLIAREVIREVARRHNLPISFTPKVHPDGVGNGAHVHLSLINSEGENQTYDASGAMNLSSVATHFSAGILKHLDALVAMTAPTPISYYRLGPHHWSCGYKAIGLQNREAAIRVTPGIGDEASKRKGHNLEYRPCDAAASPYLVLGSLIFAGLDGIKNALDCPNGIEQDPADMSDEARQKAGITALPGSLEEAISQLQGNNIFKSFFSKNLLNTYINIKNWEIEMVKQYADDEAFLRYAKAY